MNNFYTRSITAFFFGITCIASIYFGFTIHLLFFVFSFLSLTEFHKIYSDNNSKLYLYTSIGVALSIYSLLTLSILNYIEQNLLWSIPFLISLVFIAELYQKNPKPFEKISQFLLSIVYIIIPFYLFCNIGYVKSD